jgi:hypothetical protein
MQSRFRKLVVESLEGRSVLSTVAYADFNNDGLVDMAAITDTNAIEISLANPDGSFTVSDILSAPKHQPIVDIYSIQDGEADGDLDLYALSLKPTGRFNYLSFRNNGDGTFDYIEPVRWKAPKWFI